VTAAARIGGKWGIGLRLVLGEDFGGLAMGWARLGRHQEPRDGGGRGQCVGGGETIATGSVAEGMSVLGGAGPSERGEQASLHATARDVEGTNRCADRQRGR